MPEYDYSTEHVFPHELVHLADYIHDPEKYRGKLQAMDDYARKQIGRAFFESLAGAIIGTGVSHAVTKNEKMRNIGTIGGGSIGGVKAMKTVSEIPKGIHTISHGKDDIERVKQWLHTDQEFSQTNARVFTFTNMS